MLGPWASHSSATGLRLYYDSTARSARFEAEITPDPSEALFLRSDGTACTSGPGAGVTSRSLHAQAPAGVSPKCKDSSSLNFARGNPWRVIGNWSMSVP